MNAVTKLRCDLRLAEWTPGKLNNTIGRVVKHSKNRGGEKWSCGLQERLNVYIEYADTND